LNDLSQDAFRILEDGREQEIVLFTRESAALHVALVLDTSESVKPEWPDIADATTRFVEQLGPADKMALVTFDRKARLWLNWGQHADKIRGVLQGISCKDFTGLWDALWMTNDLFRDIRGRKVIILMTDGLDNTSSVRFDAVLDAAIRSERSIYVVSKTETPRSAALNNKTFLDQRICSGRAFTSPAGGRDRRARTLPGQFIGARYRLPRRLR